MPSPDKRPSNPSPDTPSLAGIIACLGALADEAQLIGEPQAAALLREAVLLLRQSRGKSH